MQRNNMISKEQQWVAGGTLQLQYRGKEGTSKTGKPKADTKKDKKSK